MAGFRKSGTALAHLSHIPQETSIEHTLLPASQQQSSVQQQKKLTTFWIVN